MLSKQASAGRAIYIGTRLDTVALGGLLGQALGHTPAYAPAYTRGERWTGDEAGADGGQVERVVRRSARASYEFMINHGSEPASVPLATAGVDLLAGAAVSGRLELPPQGVAIVRREN